MKYARFYASSQWKKLRRSKLADQPLCEECLRNGKITSATIVHHKTEVKEDWDKRLDYDTLESIWRT
ncbi:HNH endonuclease [Enterococcus faecium]|nr:HNH endonuclease [Enterococcus faecium]